MFCTQCGAQQEDSALFCTVCGASLQQAQPTPVAEEQPIQPAQPVYEQQPTQPTQPVYEQQPAQTVQPAYQQPTQPVYGQQPGTPVPGKGLAVASLVLGIVSFFCFAIITGILAIVFGAVAKNKGFKGGMATAGIVCGVIGVALWLVMMIFMPSLAFSLFAL